MNASLWRERAVATGLALESHFDQLQQMTLPILLQAAWHAGDPPGGATPADRYQDEAARLVLLAQMLHELPGPTAAGGRWQAVPELPLLVGETLATLCRLVHVSGLRFPDLVAAHLDQLDRMRTDAGRRAARPEMLAPPRVARVEPDQ